jgi:hypothetical protein
MPPLEPKFENNAGVDSLRVWMDFWELTGRLRIDIVKRSESNGDAAKMVAPEITETVIPSVPAVMMDRESMPFNDRAGEIQVDRIKLELIDTVRSSDCIRMNGIEYEIESVQESEMGNFAIWTVVCRRIE